MFTVQSTFDLVYPNQGEYVRGEKRNTDDVMMFNVHIQVFLSQQTSQCS